MFKRVVIVGVGLLGGSIGLALHDRRLAREVVGVGRRPSSLAAARESGAIDSGTQDLRQACRQADLVVVCTPVDQIVAFVQQCRQYVTSDALITDVGSTKSAICEALCEVPNFVGSHPMAGSEKSGVQHADAKLFSGRLALVTPDARSAPAVVTGVEAFWQAIGCRTRMLSPAEHDAAIARTSHLPHVVASALAAATPPELLQLTATGWSDTTRVAAGSVELWRQILLDNRGSVLAALRQYQDALAVWADALEAPDPDRLEQLLASGKTIRDSLAN